MSEHNPDLGTLARRVEARLVGWGWLVRSMPDDAGGGYFANITTPDFAATGDPARPFTGGVNGYSGPTAEAALAGALALAESRRGEVGEALRLRGGRLGQALWNLRCGGRVRRESWPAGDYIRADAEKVTYCRYLSPGRYEERTLPNLSCEAVMARDWETLDVPAASPPAAAPAPRSEEPVDSPATPETEYDVGLPRVVVTEDVPPMAPPVEQLVEALFRLVDTLAGTVLYLDDCGVDSSTIHDLRARVQEKFEACHFKMIVVGPDGRRVLGGTQ